MTTSVQFTTELTLLYCASCGIPFGMPVDYESRRRQDHGSFYCPSGHSNVFGGKSEAEQLREQLRREQRRREEAEAREVHQRDQRKAAERSVTALKGVVTRTKRRIGGGVCPCCEQSFPDLHDHMTTQHPEYAEGDSESGS
jgi:hypothetical protein